MFCREVSVAHSKLSLSMQELWGLTVKSKMIYLSPASRVSTTKSDISEVRPSTRPWPNTFTLLASPISDCTTIIVMGLFATWRPFFLMLTRCSPTSLGMKEIPKADRTCHESSQTRPASRVKNAHVPMWLLGCLFSKHGSSRPDGALMVAVRRLRSVSLMSREKSAAEPSFTWDFLLLSSVHKQTWQIRNEHVDLTQTDDSASHRWCGLWMGFLRCVCRCIGRGCCSLQVSWAGTWRCRCRLYYQHSWSLL